MTVSPRRSKVSDRFEGRCEVRRLEVGVGTTNDRYYEESRLGYINRYSPRLSCIVNAIYVL